MKNPNKLKDSIAVEVYKEDDDRQKERESLLKKTPDNELVKKMVEKKDPEEREKKWDEWSIIDDIVCCARDMYMENDKDKKEVIKLMIDALNSSV
jgi:hypothetical protein